MKLLICTCTNCDRVVDDLDNDGYCEECVIEIGISRAEAQYDID